MMMPVGAGPGGGITGCNAGSTDIDGANMSLEFSADVEGAVIAKVECVLSDAAIGDCDIEAASVAVDAVLVSSSSSVSVDLFFLVFLLVS